MTYPQESLTNAPSPTHPRVLSIHPSTGLNGAGKSWHLILEALKGHCELWTSQPGSASRETQSFTHPLPVICPQISRRIMGNAYYVLSFPFFVLAYIHLILKHRIDIVHCNGLYLLQPMLAARLCGRRLIIHVREAREKYPRLLYLFWVKFSEFLADTIICVSLPDRAHFAREDVFYVPNWISLDSRTPDTPPLLPASAPGLRPILLVSQIIEGKGHDFAIDFFHELRRLTKGVKLYIAGGTNGNPNNERYQMSLFAKVERMGLSKDIVFLGEVTDVMPLMMATGCVLMPSRSESFSRVHLEAMASGCLLIATNVGMTSYIIDDMVDGVIIRWGESLSAAKKVQEVLDNPDLVIAIKNRARKKIMTSFTANQVAPDFRRAFFGCDRRESKAICAES